MTPLAPELFEVPATVRDGRPIHLRPIAPDDKALLQEGMHRLSAQSRYQRFFSPVEELSDAQLRAFTEIDYHDHFAVVAFVPGIRPEGIGVARYIRLPEDPEVAEYAVAVVDGWQSQGVGTLLLGAVLLAARHNGIRRCYGDVLRSNTAMIDLARRFGATHEVVGAGEVRTVIDPLAWAATATGAPWDDLRAMGAGIGPPVPNRG